MVETLNTETVYLDRTINELIAVSVFTNSTGSTTTTAPTPRSSRPPHNSNQFVWELPVWTPTQ